MSEIKDEIYPWVERVEWEPEHDEPNLMHAIDEIVVNNPDYIHVERLNDKTYWMAIVKGNERQIVLFHSPKSAKIFARTEKD